MVGRQIGHYCVESPLGKGGMGEVWLARDLRLDRKVALKILPAEDAQDERRRKRFLREARLASALSHPNVVAIYDVDERDGWNYMAMEYVAGETLAQRILRGPIDWKLAREYVGQIAAALGAAHAAGITHRDLKPSNIMLTGTGQVKVLDFGLAQQEAVAEEGDATRTQLTAAGAVLGTYGYMAPEQLLGEKADARSDVFSLGVVWFELLTGESPFRGATRTEQMRRMLSEGARDIRRVTSQMPEPEAALLMKCLAGKPEERFANAGELLRAMTVREEAPRRRYGVIAAGVVLLLAVGYAMLPERGDGLAVAKWGDLNLARAALDRYDLPGNVEKAVAEVEARLAREPDSAMAYQLLAQARLFQHYVKRDDLLLRQAEGAARKAIELNGLLGAPHSVLGWALTRAGKLDDAVAPIEQGLSLNPRSALSHLAKATWAQRKKQPDLAETHFVRAAEWAEGLWYPHSMGGAFYYAQGQYEKARQFYEAALKAAPDNVRVMDSLASVYHHLERDEEAISILQKAVEVRPSGTLYSNLGTLLFFAGRYAQALPAMQKAVDLTPAEPTSWGNLADTLRWAPGRRGESIQPYRTAISLVRERLKSSPEDELWQTMLALYSVKAGNVDEARALLRKLVGVKGLGPEAQYSLGVTAELLGERGRALELLDQAVRGGYAKQEVMNDPELAGLRDGAAFRRLAAGWR